MEQDAGLEDLCVESGILAGGSVAGAFEGRAYKRGVKVHKCVLEALFRMIWQCFLPWIQDNHPDMQETVNELQDPRKKLMAVYCSRPLMLLKLVIKLL